jgi:hypothetical protein
MRVSAIQAKIEITVVLEEDEAAWLRDLLQNDTTESEDEHAHTYRQNLWKMLNSMLRK